MSDFRMPSAECSFGIEGEIKENIIRKVIYFCSQAELKYRIGKQTNSSNHWLDFRIWLFLSVYKM